MLRNKSITLHLKKFPIYSRQSCSKSLLSENRSVTSSNTNMFESLKEKMKAIQHHPQPHRSSLRKKKVSIYRVPAKLRKIDAKSYEPHFISIGPYHHGSPSLQASEQLKLLALNSLIGNSGTHKISVDKLISVLHSIEHDVRESYSEEIGLSSEKFVEMMLLDGCFIVHLFKELNENDFNSCLSLLPKRWMLPVVRRDLITLENQLPMIVLKTIYKETRSNSNKETSLERLVLNFINPLMRREKNVLEQCIMDLTTSNKDKCYHHLLDVFHSSLSLRKANRGKEPHMHRSITELKESGIKIRVREDTQLLDIKFKNGVLRIPGLQMDNHTGSVLRNIVAYEQCHHDCKPDMTAYLFFLDKLINSADDVGLMHYEGVIQHSLGSNKQVAKLVNNLCVEVEYDGNESYLCDVVESINLYSGRWLIKVKTRLKHDYFTNLWVGISTLAALLMIYLTVLQTSCDIIDAQEKYYKGRTGLWFGLHRFLLHPIQGVKDTSWSALSFINGVVFPNNSVKEPTQPEF
ncbi:UPF0481 protein At3g47200-like [Amaranthus tricolor]|uniref:UPF0481 protein At3g47200-like n=1 Tax=Amaranthus tricolor TaxID=29722 RepID=UPI00258F2118|nr:UPF0481 protein At3g47200-like [Amaranthus tricolor]